MITLHGIYDNGRIIIEEKELPKIKAKVEIIIIEKNSEQTKNVYLGKYNLGGRYDNKNIRDIAYEWKSFNRY